MGLRLSRVTRVIWRAKNELQPVPNHDTVGSVFMYSRAVAPKDKCEVQVEAMGWRSGTTAVVAAFNSREIFNLCGTHKVNVLS